MDADGSGVAQLTHYDAWDGGPVWSLATVAIADRAALITERAVPDSASVCVSGGAVSEAGNAGLNSKCEALLASRDTLAGSATPSALSSDQFKHVLVAQHTTCVGQ